MLKKARLADHLNSQIQHRPGVLELIKKNILHTEKPIEKIVKDGYLPFKATSEGLLTRPQHPSKYINLEDDSQSSESDTRNTPPRITTKTSNGLEDAVPSTGIVTVAVTIPTTDGQLVVTTAPILQNNGKFQYVSHIPPPPPPPPNNRKNTETSKLFEKLCQSVTSSGEISPNYMSIIASPRSLGSSASTLSPLSSIASPPQSLTPRPIVQSPALQIIPQLKTDAPGKEKNRKKNKCKPVSKKKEIKFHEYKGPPNAQKGGSSGDNGTPKETPYQLAVDQQTSFLKCLETLRKNQSINPTPVAIAPTQNDSMTTFSIIPQNPRPPPMPSPALSVCSSIPPPSPATSYAESMCSSMYVSTPSVPTPSSSVSLNGVVADIASLEKMKVSNLKIHLKKRNLPVSGPKTTLIERLKPYLPLEPIGNEMSSSMSDVSTQNAPMSPESVVMSEVPPAPETMEIVPMVISNPQPQTATIVLQSQEDMIREKERTIDELKRKLAETTQELNVYKMQQKPEIPVVAQKQPIIQNVAQKPMQLQVLVPTPQPVLKPTTTMIPAVTPTPITQKMIVKKQLEAKIQRKEAAKAQQAIDKAAALKKQEKPQPQQQTFITTTNFKPNYGVCVSEGTIITYLVPMMEKQQSGLGLLVQQPMKNTTNNLNLVHRIPACLQKPSIVLSAPQPPQPPPPPVHVKSENLTDVLDILIKNGDLPESALNTPTTATTPNGNNVIMTDMEGNLIFPKESKSPPLLDNIDMGSPMPKDEPLDKDKALDLFLKDSHKDTDAYDDLELFGLMSSHLDMDIEEQNSNTSPNHHHHPTPNTNIRRDMNPSLQPSLNELIKQEQQQHDNHCSSHPFVDGLFDSLCKDQSKCDSDNSANNNNTYLSTPMDVCDEFDFNFPQLSPISAINTPPHPFSSCGLSASSTTMDSSQGGSSSAGGGSAGLMMNNNDILDFLNIDDYKMSSWGEGDFVCMN